MTGPEPLQIPLPRAYLPLMPPRRYKGAKGGRGGAKSHHFASRIVAECYNGHTRAACLREVQNSIKDSVKQLIEDKINNAFGIARDFKITEREIVCPRTESVIIFRGLQNHTATSIKSLEGFNRAWYEEAQSLSQRSIELATPTFRAPGTEQLFSWNPDKQPALNSKGIYEGGDPVDAFFLNNADDPDFACVTVNYWDNPWFPDDLRRDMERDRQRDPEKYGHIWLGGYRKNSEAAVFRNWKVERFDPPAAGTPLYFGADWGMTIDPTVLVVCFIVGRTLYVWREVWEIGCGIDRRGALFDRIDPEWTPLKARDPNWKSIARRYQITADSAEPQTIDYLQRHGFPRLQAAVKGPNSVEEGVSWLQSYDIVVHPDCKFGGVSHVVDELTLHSYKIDKKTNLVLPQLEDKRNHTIDALRYALENVRRSKSSTREELRV